MSENRYKYLAFISYKREDEKWANWLQHKLESYKLPTALRKKDPSLPERIRPVFRDTTDLTGGNLEKSIKKALQCSKYLIVICSPRAAQSPWVCKEVQDFIDSGREEYIIPFIIDGEPNSKDIAKECFPRNLRELSGSRELLGINVNEMGRDAAAIKVVARMFGLQFDTLWQRWEREKRRKRRLTVILSILVGIITLIIAGVLFFQHRRIQINLARSITQKAIQLVEEGDSYLARRLLLEVLPDGNAFWNFPYMVETERAFRLACDQDNTILDLSSSTKVVKCSHDEKHLLSYSENNVQLWDIENGKCIHTLHHIGNIDNAYFHSSGNKIITFSSNVIYTWNIENGEVIDTLALHNEPFSVDYNNSLIMLLFDNMIQLWNIENKTLINEFNLKDHLYSADLSSTCKYLISESLNNLEVWDAVSGKTIHSLRTNGDITNLHFAPNDEYVVFIEENRSNDITGIDNYSLFIWNIENGYLMNILSLQYNSEDIWIGPRDYIADVILSECGQYITVVGGECIYKYDIASRSIKSFNIGAIQEAKHSPDGNFLAINTDFEVLLWDVERDEVINSVSLSSNVHHNLIFSPTGRYLLVKSFYEDYLWDITLGTCISVIEGTSFSPSEEFLISFNANKVHLLDISTLYGSHNIKLIEQLYSKSEYDYAFKKFTRDGMYVVSVGYPYDYTDQTHSIRMWRVASGDSIPRVVHGAEIFQEKIRPERSELMFCSTDSTISIWNYENGELKHNLRHCDVWRANYSYNGHIIMSSGADSLKFWDANTGDLINALCYDVNEIHFSHDDETILFTSSDSTVGLFDYGNGNLIHLFNHDEEVLAAIFSPDDQNILSYSNKSLFLWNVENENCIYKIRYPNYVNDVSFSPDGKYIVCESYDTLYVLDSKTGNSIHKFDSPNGMMFKDFSPDNKYVMASSENEVFVWDIATGGCVRNLKHNIEVNDVIFSDTGREIYVCTDTEVIVWKFDPLPDMIEREKERFKDNPLTNTERREYGLE